MRISISGTACTGKSTLIRNILAVWPNYKTPEKTYRDIIEEEELPHSTLTSVDTQWKILNHMIDQLHSYEKGDKVIFDRCPLDNLVYTLWAHDRGIEGFDKQFVDKCIALTKESMRHLDIIFLLNYDKIIEIRADGLRETDEIYIKEIDNIFSALKDQYEQNYDADIFFPKDDSPGIISLPTSPQQRIDVISDYIDPNGEIFGDEHSIFNPTKLNELELLVTQQKAALEQEKEEKALFDKYGIGNKKIDLNFKL